MIPRRLNPAAAVAAVVVLLAATGLALIHARRADGATERSEPPASALTVEVVSPGRERWPRRIQADGSMAAWQEIIVSPETGGLRIAELAVEVGASVRKGQVLARLADESVKADVRKQEALVAQAQAALDKAVADLRRAASLGVEGALAPQRLDEYRSTEASARAALASAQADLGSARLRLGYTRITAPDDGVVSSRAGVLGNVVSSGAELFRLMRQGRVEWQAELDATALAQVRPGQRAVILLPGGDRVDGTVRLLAPTLGSGSGRGTVYVSLPAHAQVRPGVFARGWIELPESTATTLPESALVPRDGRTYVLMLGEGSKVFRQAVAVGRRQDDRVEILSGVEAGSRVVARGGALILDGAVVTVSGSTEAAPR